jgi:hypothetical protein
MVDLFAVKIRTQRFVFVANCMGNLPQDNWRTKVIVIGNILEENWKNTSSLQSILKHEYMA